jgi:hypothetical protein
MLVVAALYLDALAYAGPNRKDSEPKIALSPPALFALAAVIFFLAGGIFAYVQLIGRGLQKTSASSIPYLSQEQATPVSTPSPSPVQTPELTPTATPVPTATPISCDDTGNAGVYS